MPEKSKANGINSDFENTMGSLNDEQLKEVLKKRNLYQPEAAQAAIKEAIKRGLIYSEEDLVNTEYRAKPMKKKLFPEIENIKIRVKIRKSLARGLLLSGILPLIYGVVRMNAGSANEGALVLLFGVVWMGISAWLIRQYSKTAISILFGLAGLSAIYTIILLVSQPRFVFMDKFIVATLYLLIAYGLAYLFRLKT